MFKKFLAKMGMGSAKIDFVLKKQAYELNEIVEGEFRIEGGTVEQEINHIGVDLNLKIHIKGREFSHVINHIPVSHSFIIHPGERKSLPFSYRLPNNLLITRGPISYSFITRLDIAGGVDHLDHDFVTILPPARFNHFIQALEMLGFREKMGSGHFDGHHQEFEFFPTTKYANQLQELEFTVAIEDHGLRFLLELDLRTTFGYGEKEVVKEIYISNDELENTEQLSVTLADTIEEMIQHPHQYPASRYGKSPGGAHGKHLGGLSGAMGGFAAGMLGGLLLEELLFDDETMDELSSDDNGGFDFFGGDDEF